MYEIQVVISGNAWTTSSNLTREKNRFATKEEAEEVMTKVRSVGMNYRVMRIGDPEGNDDEFNLIKLKAQIKAILAEPSKLQRIAKLLEEE
jgi:hypothetical protein